MIHNPVNNAKILYRGEYDYGTLPGQSITLLKEMLKSPKHFKHRQNHNRFESKSLSVGTTSHTAVLEPERFLMEYAIWKSTDAEGNKKQRRGKTWEMFQDQNADKIIIKDDEYREAISLRDAVRRDPIAMKYLAMGEPEIALSWTDKDTGVLCRGRADWLTRVDNQICIVDLKTTRDAGPAAFSRDSCRYSYHLQAAYYSDAIEAATGEVPKFVIVAVESHPPYDVVVYIVPEEVLEIGRTAYKELLEKLKFCQKSDMWHGQGEAMERYLTLPAWAIPGEENDDMSDLDWSEKEAA